jgi:hypothetical protein
VSKTGLARPDKLGANTRKSSEFETSERTGKILVMFSHLLPSLIKHDEKHKGEKRDAGG